MLRRRRSRVVGAGRGYGRGAILRIFWWCRRIHSTEMMECDQFGCKRSGVFKKFEVGLPTSGGKWHTAKGGQSLLHGEGMKILPPQYTTLSAGLGGSDGVCTSAMMCCCCLVRIEVYRYYTAKQSPMNTACNYLDQYTDALRCVTWGRGIRSGSHSEA